MPAMREAWTDERLDDLNAKVDSGFARVDARFDTLDARMDARFERMEARFDALNRTLMQVGGVIVAALIGVIATQL